MILKGYFQEETKKIVLPTVFNRERALDYYFFRKSTS